MRPDNMDRQKEHCKCTERDAVIYSVKNQDAGFSETGVKCEAMGILLDIL